jgi:type I restriction enzyme S subunit
MSAAYTWRTMSIEQCCLRVTSGGTPSRKNPLFHEDGTIPWVKTGELKDRIIVPSRVGEWITEEALAKSSAKMLPRDTVLMAMYGGCYLLSRLVTT